MRGRSAAKQIKRSYRDTQYSVRNFQKCAEVLVKRTRSHYRRMARHYQRMSKLHDSVSEQNLANYYWHASAKYNSFIWQDIEEMWLLNNNQQ